MRVSGARPHTTPTRRDLEVLAAVLTSTREEAAQSLGLHRTTVREHVTAICIRLQVHDRLEAARALGWLRIPEQYLTGPASRTASSVRMVTPGPVVTRVA